jgi:hypothetical protein
VIFWIDAVALRQMVWFPWFDAMLFDFRGYFNAEWVNQFFHDGFSSYLVFSICGAKLREVKQDVKCISKF